MITLSVYNPLYCTYKADKNIFICIKWIYVYRDTADNYRDDIYDIKIFQKFS